MYMPDDPRGQIKALDTLELESQMAVSCHVGVGNGSQSSAEQLMHLTTELHSPPLRPTY